jgi:hypothetical protein
MSRRGKMGLELSQNGQTKVSEHRHIHSPELIQIIEVNMLKNLITEETDQEKRKCRVKVRARYRQPGLLCTPRNFAQSSKFLGQNNFWY